MQCRYCQGTLWAIVIDFCPVDPEETVIVAECLDCGAVVTEEGGVVTWSAPYAVVKIYEPIISTLLAAA